MQKLKTKPPKKKSIAGKGAESREPVSGNTEGIIQKKVWIRASREIVYKALTDSRELTRWFCDRATCNACEGGELTARWNIGKSIKLGRAVFTRVVPNSTLELLWIDDGSGLRSDSAKHTLSYNIKSKAGMTEVVMVDSDTSVLDEETLSFLDDGWNSVLLELRDHCERRERLARIRPRAKPPALASTPE